MTNFFCGSLDIAPINNQDHLQAQKYYYMNHNVHPWKHIQGREQDRDSKTMQNYNLLICSIFLADINT